MTVDERIGILEERTTNIGVRLDEVRQEVKEMHDCLDRTRDLLDAKMESMLVEYRQNRDNFYTKLDEHNRTNTQGHQEMMTKINDLERAKNKATIIGIALAAFIAGTGYLTHGEVAKIIRLLAG
jgi:uncharacterized coiled-coil DUF342 family protein